MKSTNATMIRNIPTPAFVFDICVNDSSNDDAFPIKSDTSSVNPLLINFADWFEIFAKSPDVILKARVKSPTMNEITTRNKTTPASVYTKSLAVNSNIFPPQLFLHKNMLQLICHQIQLIFSDSLYPWEDHPF